MYTKESELNVKEIINLYLSGLSANKISKHLNISVSTIIRYLRKNGIEVTSTKTKWLNLPEDKIIKLYQKGKTLNEIAIKLNSNIRVIQKILEKNNIKRRTISDYKYKLNNRKILSSIQDKEICELYLQGYLVKEIAKKYNVSSQLISKTISRNNIKKRAYGLHTKKLPGMESEIIKLYSEGLTEKQIGDKLNVHARTINTKLNNSGIRLKEKYFIDISESIKNEILDLDKNNVNYKQISEKLNLDMSKVVNLLHMSKTTSSAYKKSFRINDEKIISMYEEGLSTNKIATETGIARSTITNLLKKNNIMIKGKSGYKKRVEAISQTQNKVEKEVILFSESKKVSPVSKVKKSTIKNLYKLTEEKKLYIKKLYKDGISPIKISKLVKLHVEIINAILEESKNINHNILTLKQKNEIINLYKQGYSLLRIAKLYKSDYKEIYIHLKNNNILTDEDLNRKTLNSEEKKEVLKMSDNNISTINIAKYFNININVIEQILF